MAAAALADAPRLEIHQQDQQVILSWPSTNQWAELQVGSADATSIAWEPVNVEAATVGDRLEVILPVAPAPQFYRLVNPLHHVLVIGQSLAMGAYATELIHTNQPFQNKMFVGQELDGSLPELPPDVLDQFVPLVERWHPEQFGGETLASGFANWISERVGPGVHDFLVSNAARGGSDYALLKRAPSGDPETAPTGTYPYLRGLQQVEAARALAGSDGYRFDAIFAVHGEGDSINPHYDEDIRQWREDYEADIRLITGRPQIVVPMFHSQISAWGNLGNATRTLSPFLTLEAHELHPDTCVLVGPKYFLPYRPEDGLHLTSLGYAWLGEYYAKAFHQHVMLKRPWSPLRPRPNGITREGNVIRIEFVGQVGDLVLDTNLVSNPRATIFDLQASPTYTSALIQVGPYGFEYWDTAGSGSPWQCSTFVTDARVAGTNTVEVILNQAPAGLKRRIRYGYTALPQSQGGAGGPQGGPRGCLRDSDPASSRLGRPLYNWCVHFDKPCP